MAFVRNQKRGPVWDDAQLIDSIIENNVENFQLNSQKEGDMERVFTVSLSSNRDRLNNSFISKIQKENSVAGVNVFDKGHYADMSIGETEIAIEVTRIGSPADKDKFARRIGINNILRLRYKFVFQIFVLDASVKNIWENIQNGSDENVKFLLDELKEQEIFTYIIPGFKTKGDQLFKVFG